MKINAIEYLTHMNWDDPPTPVTGLLILIKDIFIGSNETLKKRTWDEMLAIAGITYALIDHMQCQDEKCERCNKLLQEEGIHSC